MNNLSSTTNEWKIRYGIEDTCPFQTCQGRVEANEALGKVVKALDDIVEMANKAIQDPLGSNINDLIRIRDLGLAAK